MKKIFDDSAIACSKLVTNSYSTSFSLAVKMLYKSIQPAIYSIYGFVRYADEVVDTFHDYDKEVLLEEFKNDFYKSLERGISLNPILHSFQQVVIDYNIDLNLIQAFLRSMKMDLTKSKYSTYEEYKAYIYGSADVVGLMCLKVFVNGDQEKYEELKESAMALGSAFQKVNFLRDIKQDFNDLERSYFPGVDLINLDERSKARIIEEIEDDFAKAYKGILKLPNEAKFGVYTAYVYYKKLLSNLKKTEPVKIAQTRIRVSNPIKILLLGRSYITYKLNLL
ncbi:MAG: phytoene/squalene synthase family protein [Saprospiraceae bacterium]|nr:phytoene/squalene synthase family protein [Saprospiraceae bacterium]